MRARIKIAMVVAASFVAPAAGLSAESGPVPLPTHHVGDTWVDTRRMEQGTNGFAEQQYRYRIESIGADTMVLGIKLEGSPSEYQDHIVGLDLSQRRAIDGQETITARPYSFPMTIGKTCVAAYTDPNRHGRELFAHFHEVWRATGWEDVVTPVGTFHCMRTEANGTVELKLGPSAASASGVSGVPGDVTSVNHLSASGPQTIYNLETMVFDYSPELGVTVKAVEDHYNSENVRMSHETHMLVSFQHGS